MSRARAWTGVALVVLCAALAIPVSVMLRGAHLATDIAGVRHALRAPEMLATALVLPLLVWGAWGSLVDLPATQRRVALALRLALVATLVLALARPAQERDATRVSAVVLVDTSESISDASLAAARAFVRRAIETRGDDDLQLVTFAGRPHRAALPTPDTVDAAIWRAATDANETPATDLQAAVRLAYGLFRAGHLRRIALVSDGLETHGDLLEEAARAVELGVRVHHRVLDEGAPPEVAIRAVSLPGGLRVGENFEVRATLFATRSVHARLRLYQGAVLNGLDAVRDVDLARGDTQVSFTSVVRTPGTVDYRLELEPSGPDRFPDNNRFTTTAIVPGRPSVLLVDDEPAQVTPLASALEHAGYAVALRSALAFPRTLVEIAQYDFVVLSDVPAERLSSEQMEVVERYVRDVGGGFLMAGGEHAFGLGGYQGTRLEELLPVRMDSERRRDEQSLALALVIDCSGSMVGPKIELAKEAAKATAELLGPGDSLGVIGFAGEPNHAVRMQPARNRVGILQSIGRLVAQGGTAIFPALDAAFQDLLAARARVKHVILLTDGQTRESGISDLVQAMRAEGITVTAVGLGTDVNRTLLQAIANMGGGRVYFTDDPNNVPRIFVRETTTVGRNSAVEEMFQAHVAEPADFLAGIDVASAPFLRGYVATQPKPAPAQVLLTSDLGEPLLARWRVGLGWALAWTSDAKGRWATDWIRWQGFSPFWGELVREHMRHERQEELPMRADVHDGVAHVSVDALGADDTFLNDLRSELSVIDPPGSARHAAPEPIALHQRAPGRYEARVPLHGYGSFVLHARHAREGRPFAHSDAQVSYPYPPEYAMQEPNRALLTRVSRLTGGRELAAPDRLFDPGSDRIASAVDCWPSLVFLALGLFLVDLLLRRVRWGEAPTPARDPLRIRPAL